MTRELSWVTTVTQEGPNQHVVHHAKVKCKCRRDINLIQASARELNFIDSARCLLGKRDRRIKGSRKTRSRGAGLRLSSSGRASCLAGSRFVSRRGEEDVVSEAESTNHVRIDTLFQ